ncbi:hypothetical protein [Aeromonas veronii]
MTESKPIDKKLAQSDAFHSIKAEHTALNILNTHGWKPIHSPYYKDMISGKLRELDLAGRQIWCKNIGKHELIARIHIYVEIKSAPAFHILCAGETAQHSFGNNEYWPGYCDETKLKIQSALDSYGISLSKSRDYLHKLDKLIFPKSTMLTAPIRIQPMPADECYSAFRETDTNKEKDLDNSVLWRAISTLNSAINSAKNESINKLLSNFTLELEMCRRKKADLTLSLGAVESHSRIIDFYIPLVLIESRLWSALNHDPEEIPWFRFVQNNTYGASGNWTDVINLKYLDTYLSDLAKYLEETLYQRDMTQL